MKGCQGPCVGISMRYGFVVRVSPEDVDLFLAHRWSVQRESTLYVRCNQKPWLLHRFVMGVGPGVMVDHIDGDGLHNCRGNLRVATALQNAANRGGIGRSGYKGVGVVERRKGLRYVATLGRNSRVWLGTFDTAEQAAEAYNRAAYEAYGDYAYLNPLPGWEVPPLAGFVLPRELVAAAPGTIATIPRVC